MGFADKFSQSRNANFSARIIKDRALIYDVRFPEGDRTAIFILEIEHAKLRDFQRTMDGGGPIKLSDYGTILYASYNELPESLKAELREKYGAYEE